MTLRIAFLGSGFATRLHSRTLRKFADVERIHVSRDPERAAAFVRKHGGIAYPGGYSSAIDDPGIDVIFIATPPDSHLTLATAALAAGKHVIVEKPPFLSTADLDQVAGIAAEAGRRVFVAENYFYKPLLIELRQLITSGSIGDVRLVTINALKRQRTTDWRDRPEIAGGGAFFEGGIHWVNFMANLGLEVVDASGFRPGPRSEPDRTMVAVFEYAEGAVGTLLYSWEIGSPMKGLRLSSVYGTDGAITFESNGLVLGVRGRKKRIGIPRPTDLLGYRAMFEDFFRAIREGTPAAFELSDARRDLALVERIYETAER